MAKDETQALVERLFTTFLAPLVLGGAMVPAKPFGGKNALSIGDGRSPSSADLLSRCELSRVRVARKLAPVDGFDPAPSGAEWALAAVLHDLVQSTHPGFDAVFRRSGPQRILTVVDRTLEQIRPPRDVGEALSRHTWLSRMFELARTDVEVKWWTGSQTFLGEDPPGRLTAWPEVRRVQQIRTPRPLMDLPTSGASVDASRFATVIDDFLARTPLTDLATLNRPSPVFAWKHESLALCSTQAGRTLALRSFAFLPERAVDAALGRATRHLLDAKASRALGIAVDVLRDRALMTVVTRLDDRDADPLAAGSESADAAFTTAMGAIAATHWITQTGGGLDLETRGRVLRLLQPAATSAAAREVRALMAG